jgi:katanin p80 WD40 repeat-containing subunit B1
VVLNLDISFLVVRTLTEHRAECSAVEFHPFGELLGSGSIDSSVKVWDLRQKTCIQTYHGHEGSVRKLKFSPDGKWVVSGGLDGIVKVSLFVCFCSFVFLTSRWA